MPDLIIGQPTNLTTVTDNGAGFCRVHFFPWELDWEFFGDITPGLHFITNTTVGNSSGVTAKGGAENLGYWFDTNRAFPGGWASGDRFSPQRQAAIFQFATFAAAVAAMAFNDVLLAWYQNVVNRRFWTETISFNNIGGSVLGMLSRSQICLSNVNAAANIAYQLNLAGMNQQAVVRNLCSPRYNGGISLFYNPTAGTEGAGVRFSRNICIGNTGGIRADRSAAGTILVDNNFFYGISTQAILFGAAAAVPTPAAYFNTAVRCRTGFQLSNTVNAGNLVAVECFNDFLLSVNNQNCADTDGSLPIHATNLRNQDMRTQLQFFYDLARPGNKAFPNDFRIHQDSVLTAAGVAVAGLGNDADGQLRPAVPSIGAYEPYSTCYAPAAEIIRGAGKRGAGT